MGKRKERSISNAVIRLGNGCILALSASFDHFKPTRKADYHGFGSFYGTSLATSSIQRHQITSGVEPTYIIGNYLIREPRRAALASFSF